MAAKKKKKTVTAAPSAITVNLRMFFSLASAPGVSRWDAGGRPIQNAVVRVRGTSISATTNAAGRARLPLGTIIGTGRVLEIEPAAGQLSTGPATTTHGGGGFASAPSFLFRPFQATVDINATGYVLTAPARISLTAVAGSPPHALVFARTASELTLDWKADWIKSGNRAAVTPKRNEFLVIHQTGVIERIGNHLNTFTNPANVTGIHYLVDVDGHVVKLVHESDRVNHTGPAFWDGSTSVNSRSIGIEIVHSDTPTVHPFTNEQYATVIRLVRELRAAHATITRQHVVGHGDVATTSAADSTISPRRSGDPGPQFEWERLETAGQARTRVVTPGPLPATFYGIGAREVARLGARRSAPPTLAPNFAQIQRDLLAIGFSIAANGTTVSGIFDLALQRAVGAFQRRYFTGSRAAFRGPLFGDGDIDFSTAQAIQMIVADTGP